MDSLMDGSTDLLGEAPVSIPFSILLLRLPVTLSLLRLLICPQACSLPRPSLLTQFHTAIPCLWRFLIQTVWDLLTIPERSAVPVSAVEGTQGARQTHRQTTEATD